MYALIIIGCLAAAVVSFRRDPRTLVPAALALMALLTALFAADAALMGVQGSPLADVNRAVWLLLYTAGPLFSAVILFVYAATVLPAERFTASHKVALAGGVAAVGLAAYHVAYFNLGLPATKLDLGFDMLAALFSYIPFMYASYALATALYLRSGANRRPFDVIMVLGHRLDGDRMHPILVARLDEALARWETDGRRATFLLSGGQCFAGTRPEAEAMRDYLRERGVPDEKLLVEAKSRTTRENMERSQALIEGVRGQARCLVVTSGFHLLRGLANAAAAGIDAQGVSARAPRGPLLAGLTTREMMAFVFRHKTSVLLFAEAVLFLEAWRYVTIPPGLFN
ncbi:YdcF family protein [Arabiibacter massiliensis]|uniref:YdcF family protein n=1 Tax=Arabiibacter massiliensis TaxID=1870985 RepID=UPI0009BAAD44|nr:YdcF family protein [Arabiibacter massiliensis]